MRWKRFKKTIPVILGAYFGFLKGGDFCLAGTGVPLQFDEKVFDFGEIWQDEKVEHEFVFRNVSEKTVEIVDVRASCGCTATMISEEDMELEPGEQGVLSVTFDSAGRYGKQNKTVRLIIDDRQQRNLVCAIQGLVKEYLVPSVRIVNLGDIPKGTRSTPRAFTLESGDGNAFEVTEVTPSSGGELKCSFHRTEQGVFEITVGLAEVARMEEGELLKEGAVFVHTTHPHKPKLRMPIRWKVTKEIVCPQRRIVLVTEQGRVVKGTFDVVRVTEGTFEIAAIEPLHEFVSQKIEELEGPALQKYGASSGYKVTLAVSPSAPVGNHMREIFVKTDDPGNTDVKLIFALRVHPSKRKKGS